MKIRQPIITVVGHVDHGKTSILDSFRSSNIQEGEAGGITQKISFTLFPEEQLKKACPLIVEQEINLEIPGFLFIDTPGHAAFTNLRKRGGSLSDLAILVVSIKDGIKPQTAEVLQILKSNKTPFIIALNKIDTISGWSQKSNLKESIDKQAVNVKQEFDQALLTFQGSLQEHGFDSELFYDVTDFSKQVSIVPCSAKTQEGISELLFTLSGLSQKFLKEILTLSPEAKGVILEVKKDSIDAILYDGELKTGDTIAVASLDQPVITKVRALEEILPLSFKYKSTNKAIAATGLRLHLTNKEGIQAGMPFQILKNIKQIKEEFKEDISGITNLDKEGIIIKADSLGSLEALITLLKQANIKVVKAGIGPINKSDTISAKANLEINPLNAVILGFNTNIEDDIEPGNIKILTDKIVYKLIEDLQEWREFRQKEIHKQRLMELATICKLEILHEHVFRNSNPAVFGVRVLAGTIKANTNLIDDQGEEIARLKSMQLDKEPVSEAKEGQELAISLPGIMFDRKLGDKKFLYSSLSDKQIKEFKKNKDLLSAQELKILDEISNINRIEQ